MRSQKEESSMEVYPMRQVQPLIPVALYARVSSDRQDVDLSVAAQPRAWCDYAKDNGYTVTRSTCTRPRVGAPLTGPSSA